MAGLDPAICGAAEIAGSSPTMTRGGKGHLRQNAPGAGFAESAPALRPGEEAVEKLAALGELVAADEFVGLVRDVDRARAADDRGDAGALEQAGLAREGDGRRRVGAGQAAGQRLGR